MNAALRPHPRFIRVNPWLNPILRSGIMIRFLTLLLWLAFVLQGWPSRFDERFAVVFIDAQTEAQYGGFPLDRKYIAQAVERLAERQAKGVVPKFFFDLPRQGDGDARLAQAMGKLPVLLEARIDDTQDRANPFPETFCMSGVVPSAVQTFSGESGWIPLASLSAKARGIGFVDLPEPGWVPIVEKYRGKVVKSLHLCALELALDTSAKLAPGRSLTLAGKTIELDPDNRVQIRLPAANKLAHIKFHDLLSGKLESRALQGKVVIVGYDGAKIQLIQLPLGPIKAHRYFTYGLQDLCHRLE
jgi:hypothetical protein